MEKGVPIRVVTRTLNVLKAINRGRSMTMMEIARACDLAYPTTCRIVQSLVCEGFVEMEPQRKAYRPTALVQSLSYGFQGENAFAAAARPSIVALTQEIGWPATISTRVADSMVIRDSTHSLTTMTFAQYYPGFAMPIWGSASGKVHLACCDPDERQSIIDSMRLKRDSSLDPAVLDDQYIDDMVKNVRRVGFATMMHTQFTTDPGKTSSVAVPLKRGEAYVAALAIVFFSSAMSPAQAVDQYMPAIRRTQDAIGQATAAVPAA